MDTPLWGVRVQAPFGARVQKVQRVQRGRLTALRAEGCGRLSAAGCVSLRSGSDSACGAEGDGIALTGDEYEISVTGLALCVIWHEKHSADWLAALASPYPAAPDFHLKVKRLTMICASLALLQIMFAVHPRESVSHDSQVALLPYESCSLATPVQGAEQPVLKVESLIKR